MIQVWIQIQPISVIQNVSGRDVATDAAQTDGDVSSSSSKAARLCEGDALWWNKELQEEFYVRAVTIKGNNEKFKIYVSNEDNSASSTCELAVLEDVRGKTFICLGRKIKHITVCGPNKGTISSIKATITSVNKTKNAIVYGKVTQSSTYNSETEAENVLDNAFGARECLTLCSLTQLEWNPWLRLELDEKYLINSVTLFNRNDLHGIRNFNIRITISVDRGMQYGVKCGLHHFIRIGGATTAVCSAMEKNYIKLVIPDREEYLGICGIDVDVDNSHVSLA
uniref:fucolectin-6-like n=1 Tax=Myxine glutinosa TaxID=7769 RepID=UPI00358EB59C